jgi:hypothetical protein
MWWRSCQRHTHGIESSGLCNHTARIVTIDRPDRPRFFDPTPPEPDIAGQQRAHPCDGG